MILGTASLCKEDCETIYYLITLKTKIMKTKFFLLAMLFMLVSTTTACAQFYKLKKVAITEVVDKTGEVNDGTKVFIRSALTDAITNSEGYEGYDKISFIYYEASFDSTGHISEATLQIVQKQQCEYILVAEINQLDKKTALLSARIVHTATGKIVASSSERCYAHTNDLKRACNNLACKLVGAI